MYWIIIATVVVTAISAACASERRRRIEARLLETSRRRRQDAQSRLNTQISMLGMSQHVTDAAVAGNRPNARLIADKFAAWRASVEACARSLEPTAPGMRPVPTKRVESLLSVAYRMHTEFDRAASRTDEGRKTLESGTEELTPPIKADENGKVSSATRPHRRLDVVAA